MEYPINDAVKMLLNQRLSDLEQHLTADVLTFHGPILEGFESSFRQVVEQLCKDANKKDVLFIILTTPGGSSIAVERHVNIIRHHYKEVNFIVPDHAYSAGTIFCMSGDKIFMDYFSVLGPVDPQVTNKEGRMVPALGYLDKINELIKKAQHNELTQAEFIILKEFDLAELRAYEQAKELTIDQLKKWLVSYKFKNWDKHKNGTPVTTDEKIERAREIADKLSDSNLWKSHSRPINIRTLEDELKLKIEDFEKDTKLKNLIINYHRLVNDYVKKNRMEIFIHTRSFI